MIKFTSNSSHDGSTGGFCVNGVAGGGLTGSRLEVYVAFISARFLSGSTSRVLISNGKIIDASVRMIVAAIILSHFITSIFISLSPYLCPRFYLPS